MDYLFNIYSRVSVWKYVHYINRINSIFSINKLQFYTIQAPKIQSGPTIFYAYFAIFTSLTGFFISSNKCFTDNVIHV